jgi:hypothetical protein
MPQRVLDTDASTFLSNSRPLANATVAEYRIESDFLTTTAAIHLRMAKYF